MYPNLAALLDRLDLPNDLAYDPKWSAAPDFLNAVADHVLAARPETILECSSGTSTVILARCCQVNGRGRVYSLENGPEFAASTRAELARLGLSTHAAVIDAPLLDWPLGGSNYQWYALDHLPEHAIDMLVIDGPPGFLQPLSRYPALPLLYRRLSESAAIYLDDAARPDERAIVSLWLREHPELSHRYVELERGCAILRGRG